MFEIFMGKTKIGTAQTCVLHQDYYSVVTVGELKIENPVILKTENHAFELYIYNNNVIWFCMNAWVSEYDYSDYNSTTNIKFTVERVFNRTKPLCKYCFGMPDLHDVFSRLILEKNNKSGLINLVAKQAKNRDVLIEMIKIHYPEKYKQIENLFSLV